MRLVYVIDPRNDNGYVCRVPLVLARWIERHVHFLDWASKPWGEDCADWFTGPEIVRMSTWVGFRRMVAELRATP